MRGSILTDEEIEQTIRSFLRSRATRYATEDEITAVVKTIAHWKVCMTCFQMLMRGEITVDLDESGRVVLADVDE